MRFAPSNDRVAYLHYVRRHSCAPTPNQQRSLARSPTHHSVRQKTGISKPIISILQRRLRFSWVFDNFGWPTSRFRRCLWVLSIYPRSLTKVASLRSFSSPNHDQHLNLQNNEQRDFGQPEVHTQAMRAPARIDSLAWAPLRLPRAATVVPRIEVLRRGSWRSGSRRGGSPTLRRHTPETRAQWSYGKSRCTSRVLLDAVWLRSHHFPLPAISPSSPSLSSRPHPALAKTDSRSSVRVRSNRAQGAFAVAVPAATAVPGAPSSAAAQAVNTAGCWLPQQGRVS